ncbi:uncharacterized protein LOC110239668 [Exaiptasia diaphana]|uniref:Tox-ART-HYD1 domain-containing protein n=1 Tax=Exaiptasia diaphana TaxID=2652724 RepID=A0A913X9K5_EXADI|nr:uncharacterized protein LOC110239668 [Exaiptasia diaphana]KXJ13888.1 hypothetical protein AC249_AIPGENE13243 [Exaiptasia diaphana]
MYEFPLLIICLLILIVFIWWMPKEKYFYHYTDERGAYGILSSGIIKESTDTQRDAILGKGVYVTDLPPRTLDNQLLVNNYDGATKAGDTNNVSYCVQLVARGLQINRFMKDLLTGRQVYKHEGDIMLSEYNVQIFRRA